MHHIKRTGRPNGCLAAGTTGRSKHPNRHSPSVRWESEPLRPHLDDCLYSHCMYEKKPTPNSLFATLPIVQKRVQ
ncbi:unnamed protein product [Protopolystoma xenopodis]|uniref:Uncharacterized protein n=1 Tax=Protopolystoma xenopodis TaxID=117903 RepID=A0A3S5A4Y0_9PLAT|nr:unnamed protein product [Protopolystoma xenopodis]